ncbi:MAG: ABC transporter, partial [Micromonosporaceae bacterium]|nr:ABC transporter [Micromonosporaceae bacterium]
MPQPPRHTGGAGDAHGARSAVDPEELLAAREDAHLAARRAAPAQRRPEEAAGPAPGRASRAAAVAPGRGPRAP